MKFFNRKKPKPLTEQEAIDAHLKGLIDAFGQGALTLDLALREMTDLAGKMSDKKRTISSQGICKILDQLEGSIAEAKSILKFENGDREYRV